jgi:hypothetical protein
VSGRTRCPVGESDCGANMPGPVHEEITTPESLPDNRMQITSVAVGIVSVEAGDTCVRWRARAPHAGKARKLHDRLADERAQAGSLPELLEPRPNDLGTRHL